MVTSEQIAARAYHHRFLARGGEHGHDKEDWIAAERELRSAYDVVLVDPGAGLIEVMRKIRDLTGLAIPQVKDLIDARPRSIKRAPSLPEAETLQRALESAGAKIELRAVKS